MAARVRPYFTGTTRTSTRYWESCSLRPSRNYARSYTPQVSVSQHGPEHLAQPSSRPLLQHTILQQLLSANAQWAEGVHHADPEFFRKSSQGQFPKILWIGCSDSRVPESVITAARPGDIFVHRNVANQFHLDDDSALSILTFALQVLFVEHVIIVGHTNCGGAEACLKAAQSQIDTCHDDGQVTIPGFLATAPINRWLAPLTGLARSLELSAIPFADALTKVVEANVTTQVENLCKAEPIVRMWARQNESGREAWVHGWVYDVKNGRLRDLGVSRGPSTS